MEEKFRPDDVDIKIMKVIFGEKKVEPFECGNIRERIAKLQENDFIQENADGFYSWTITRLIGNKIVTEKQYKLTDRGKRKIGVLKLDSPLRTAYICACGNKYDIIQRHTGKYQAICTRCGMRGPFYPDVGDVEKWLKQEHEKEECLTALRAVKINWND